MEFNKKNMMRLFFLAACIILFYLGFKHMDIVFSFINWLLNVLVPFIIAGVVVILLNVPLKAIERHLFRPKNKPVSPLKDKLRRPIAIVLSICIFLAIIALFLVIIIPEIGKSLQGIAEKIPDVISRLQEWVAETAKREDFFGQVASQVNIDWDTIQNTIVSFLQDNSTTLVNSAFNVISSIISVAVNVFLGIVLAVYILAKKEKIASDIKKLVYSIFPMKKADYLVEVGQLTNKSFYNSITGQMIECVIIGVLTSLGMTIFGFPYAALGGVVVALMSWIPMFGIFIGSAIVALLLLATADPMQALWFIIYMVVLQQIEGNLIFPRVVGSRIGLPPIIMISAIVLFSAFFGIIGLLVCGPVTYVLYTLGRRFVASRLKEKNIPRSKYQLVYDRAEAAEEFYEIKKGLSDDDMDVSDGPDTSSDEPETPENTFAPEPEEDTPDPSDKTVSDSESQNKPASAENHQPADKLSEKPSGKPSGAAQVSAGAKPRNYPAQKGKKRKKR